MNTIPPGHWSPSPSPLAATPNPPPAWPPTRKASRQHLREMGNLLPNNQRQRRTCYSLCHILYPVSAAHMIIFRMDSNSTSHLQNPRNLASPIICRGSRTFAACANRLSLSLSAVVLHEKRIDLKPFWPRGLLHSMFFKSDIKELV